MVNCAVIGCSASSVQRGHRFFTIPKVVTNKGDIFMKKTERRRKLWLSRIARESLTDEAADKPYNRVCGRHFFSGEPAAVHDVQNPDWAPSLFMRVGQNPHLIDESVSGHDESGTSAFSPEDGFPPDLCDVSIDEKPVDIDVKPLHLFLDCPPPRMDSISNDANTFIVKMEDVDTIDNNSSVNESCGVDISMNSVNYDSLKDNELEVMKGEFSDLRNRYIQLRNSLTEAECDKLELTDAVNELKGRCANFVEEKNSLLCQVEAAAQEMSTKDVTIQKLAETLHNVEDRLNEASQKLEKILPFTLSLDLLQENENLLKFYTGLPNYAKFECLVKFVSARLSESPLAALAPWQCILLTLMRLRLALTLQDLAYRFNIAASTTCRVFEKYLHAMYLWLKPLIKWPERETLLKSMPSAFTDAFENRVVVIIDCFEIFMEKASAFGSDYKHRSTVKYLVGITPCGAISFISDGWGGSTSDKELTERSGLCEKLFPGDIVMAGQGFMNGEDIDFYCAKLLAPAFTRGKAQLSAHDVTESRKMAHLRSHVKRVIGLVRRKYHILQSILQTDFLVKKSGHDVSQIDEIVHVCCGLANLSDSDCNLMAG